ncbi:hypothetical protein OTU49_008473 [Cherax quadricarinatus]|uniref:Uncharacterized protein n=1 Tax=Cherax quadricarinatus TaxID=27406 RepID=A0AAW0WUK6_CHEQU
MDGVEYESREDVDDTECSTSAEMDGMEYAANTGVDEKENPISTEMDGVEYAANTDVDDTQCPTNADMNDLENAAFPYSNYVEQTIDGDLDENNQDEVEEFDNRYEYTYDITTKTLIRSEKTKIELEKEYEMICRRAQEEAEAARRDLPMKLLMEILGVVLLIALSTGFFYTLGPTLFNILYKISLWFLEGIEDFSDALLIDYLKLFSE